MSLPKLEIPVYEAELPISKVKVKYRPFLVKEQKAVLITSQSSSFQDVVVALCDLISACTFNKIDPKKIPLLDFEFLLLKIRSKSVSELVELSYKCNSCKKVEDIVINLDTLEYPEYPSRSVLIADDIYVELKYPTIESLIVLGEKPEALETAIHSTVSIIQGETVFSEFTKEEISDFYNSLTDSAASKVRSFFDGIKSVKYEKKLKCSKCGNEDTVKVEGVLDFFV